MVCASHHNFQAPVRRQLVIDGSNVALHLADLFLWIVTMIAEKKQKGL